MRLHHSPLAEEPGGDEHAKLLAVEIEIGLDAEPRGRGPAYQGLVVPIVLERADSRHTGRLLPQRQLPQLQRPFHHCHARKH